jgi:coenzyme Q-binding protein COQ10
LDFPRYSAAQLFALASDIEKYPHFVPGCVAARIVEKGETRWRVDNVFAVGPMRYRFTSIADVDPDNALDIRSSEGPWKSFRLSWRFTELAEGCRVGCRFAVEFRSGVLAAVAHFVTQATERRIMAAFEKRARALYGR